VKGKINRSGTLCIERKGTMREQVCVNTSDSCCDFCPQFGEPRGTCDIEGLQPADLIGKTLLKICQNRVLVFDEFKDERLDNSDGE